MKKEILENIDNPKALEKLYRENKSVFKNEFNETFGEVQNSVVAKVWYERLNFEAVVINAAQATNDLIFVIVGALIAGIFCELPNFSSSINAEFFYTRNVAFIAFPALIAYFSIKNKLSIAHIALITILIIASGIFINMLPENQSDTLNLTCIHLPLFVWSIWGFSYVGGLTNYDKRVSFLKFNGELVVMGTLIMISGGLFLGITAGLFKLIKVEVEPYFKYLVPFGLAAVPVVATYLIQRNPQLVNRVSPVIAKIFSPIVLITLIVYLIAVVNSEQNLYSDREFLLIFNVLLIGVMAIILFSVVEYSRSEGNRFGLIILFLLSIITIIVNGFALSAILFRISEWGITPNRLAVLGGNVLILSNLLLVSYNIFKVLFQYKPIEIIGKAIALFLPIYTCWTIIVAFVFPYIFSFK